MSSLSLTGTQWKVIILSGSHLNDVGGDYFFFRLSQSCAKYGCMRKLTHFRWPRWLKAEVPLCGAMSAAQTATTQYVMCVGRQWGVVATSQTSLNIWESTIVQNMIRLWWEERVRCCQGETDVTLSPLVVQAGTIQVQREKMWWHGALSLNSGKQREFSPFCSNLH